MRKDWTETTLGHVAIWGSGGTPKSDNPAYYDGDIPWCVIGDLTEGEVNVTEKCISEEGLRNSSAKIVQPGAVMIAMYGASIGRTGVVAIPMATNQAIAFAYVDEAKIVNMFLLTYLQTQKQRFIEAGQGAAQPNISQTVLKDWSILLPPLAEQRRIVDVVSSVDAYVDALQQQVDSARTARNAVLHDLLSVGGNDWTETTLGEISEVAYGYTESASETEVGPKFLRITDIQNGNVDWSLVPFCPIEKKQYEKQRLKDGDIVFARTGATTGKSFLISNPPAAVCASYLIRLRPNETAVIPYFLNLNFQTDEYWMNIKSGMSGSAQGGFNASKLSSLSVSLPPVEEQKRIVGIVSSMDEMIHATEQAVFDAKALRSGLLSDLLSGNHEIPASYDSLLGAA